MSDATYNQLFGNGNGSSGAMGGWSMSLVASKSITFTQAGRVCLTAMGGGGGGAKCNWILQQSGYSEAYRQSGSGTGGNSAAWGRKTFSVSAGSVLVMTIGAGGAGATTFLGNGSAGSFTRATLDGTTILTCLGGEGGRSFTGVGYPPSPSTTSITGADHVVIGLSAGGCVNAGGSASGGAAVDVRQTGLGQSPTSTALDHHGGSVGTNSGGDTLPWLYADFGIAGGNGTSAGSPGRGGSPGGAFAGGSTRASGGLGAGGGGSCAPNESAGNGGPGYAYLIFQPDPT